MDMFNNHLNPSVGITGIYLNQFLNRGNLARGLRLIRLLFDYHVLLAKAQAELLFHSLKLWGRFTRSLD